MGKFSELINSDRPVLVDFYATWCGPCKAVAPVLKELADEMPGVYFIKVDVDKNPAAAAKYGVRGVPTFVLFRRGEQLWRGSGAMDKMRFRAQIENALG